MSGVGGLFVLLVSLWLTVEGFECLIMWQAG